jgi:N-methylhydantoinase A
VKRVGIDIGGTFTDLVLLDEVDGSIAIGKVPSTPDDPSRAAAEGIGQLVASAAAAVGYIGHGTTVATNAVIQRTGAKTALITTRGFRDVLEIRRLARPPELIYDVLVRLPEPLVPRRLRFEVTERVAADGRVLTPLDEGEVRQIAAKLKARGVEAVAVCLLFSFLYPAHEQAIKRILAAACPGLPVSLSSEILPEFREYERTSTTVMNAYVQPLTAAYLLRMEERVRDLRLAGQLYIMQSNGGVAAPATVAHRPVTTLLSGPAGGVIAGAYVGQQVGLPNVITIDMGGTSFDVSLVPEGRPQVTEERKVLDQPVLVPMLDVHTIGAGGGSIAWRDAGGTLRVGPQSAGAVPGPACYGRGGTQPTVTDANVVLGYLNPKGLAGGAVPLDPALAAQACGELGKQFGLATAETAEGIYRIVNAAMTGAIRAVSVRRGYDPRDFALVAFGGAGPVHAVALAAELDIPWIVVPLSPGCHSAFGLVVADMLHDYAQSYVIEWAHLDRARLGELLAELQARGESDLVTDGIPPERRRYLRELDLRYLGQHFNTRVVLPDGPIDDALLAEVERRFHDEHERVHGFKAEGEPLELVNVRLTAIGLVPKPAGAAIAAGERTPPPPATTRQARFAGQAVACPIYERGALRAGNVLAGPAIVEQLDTTTVLPPGWLATVDRYGNLILGRTEWTA